LKFFPVKSFIRSRYPVAIAAGLLLAISFPNLNLAGFGWIAPGFLLAVAAGTRGAQSFRIGYVAGVAHYLASLYWLLLIPVTGFPILGWVALSAFLALYPAIWVWLAMTISGIGGKPSTTDPATKWPRLVAALSSRSWSRRTVWALSCAAIWVGLEMVIARLFGGFPWNLLSASQYRMIPLIQIAAITGVYGISFLLVWTSVSLLNAISGILAHPTMRSAWTSDLMLPLLAVAGAFAFGFHELRKPEGPWRVLRVALIQPSIPQTLIWDPDNDMNRFQELMALSKQALTNGTDVLVWPEAAIPRLLRYEPQIREPLFALARSHGVWIIVGSDDAEPRKETSDPNDADYYNSSFLISPEGELVGRYRKRNLVIFGEYIPLVRWLPFIKWFTPVTGSFTPGDKAEAFEMPNLAAKTSVLICFEDNFPHLVREHTEDDIDFLLNLTNNGWFGEGAAQWQHAANAVFRAVENGLPLVRCTNNGLTCWVVANGRLRETFRDRNGSVYGAGFMIVDLPLRTSTEKRMATFYNQHGDWFGWACVAWACLLLVAQFRTTRNRLENQ
jgi:apolipoprotein N-acyltransferase